MRWSTTRMCTSELTPDSGSPAASGNESDPVRVLILCQLFYPELISTGQTLTELAEQLVAFGVDVEVLCGPPTILRSNRRVPKRMEHRGIPIRRVWGTRFPKLSLPGRTVNQVTFTVSAFLHLLFHRPRRPILVLTNPPFLAAACALLRALHLGPPFLYVLFDIYPDTAVRLGVLKDGSFLARMWERMNLFVHGQASAIVVIGRCMENVVRRKLGQLRHFPDDRLHRIHLWCDDGAIASTCMSHDGLAERFDIRNQFVVGYYGNMGRFHDIETILAAAERLRREENIVFLFVGEGHKKRWAMEYAREFGLNNCRFHTYVPREELGHLLSLADVGLVSLADGQEGLSVPSKTFGLMAAGVPVLAVVPKASEIARIVEEENCGIQIEPGDKDRLAQAILRLYGDRQLLRSIGENGWRAVGARYSLAHAARQYLDVLAQIKCR